MPEAEYWNTWWCMWHTGSRPQGEDRQHCFPSDPSVTFIPMIRDKVDFTNGTAVAVPGQYPVRSRVFLIWISNRSRKNSCLLSLI